jgi:hypothetical protein
MYEADPNWKTRANNALTELQRRVNAAIEAMDELHGDALIDPVASSNSLFSCRVADLDRRLSRVYFLAFLNPSRGQPGPAPYRQVGQSCNRR